MNDTLADICRNNHYVGTMLRFFCGGSGDKSVMILSGSGEEHVVIFPASGDKNIVILSDSGATML